MARVDLHLIQSTDCSDATYKQLVQFLLPEMKSELFELHTIKPGTQTALQVSIRPSFEELFSIADAYRKEHEISTDAFVFVVTENLNLYRFFCALGDGDSRSGFIHAKVWKDALPDLSTKAEAAANAYLIYSLILRRFQYTASQHLSYTDVFQHAEFVHRDAKSCFNNWVADKRLIENLLNSVHICKACQEKILAGGLSTQHFKVVKHVFEKIRSIVQAIEENDPFENGQIYVFQNHIEIVYAQNDNAGTISFSKKVGLMTQFTLYVYALLMNRKVDLLEWNNDPTHFQWMRRIVSVAQGAVLIQPLNQTTEERYKELDVLKKFGTLNPNRSFEFLDMKFPTTINRINEKIENVFLNMGLSDDHAQLISSEYRLIGSRDLELKFDRSRVYFADCWVNEFAEEFPHMQRMPE
jgi:hypothetical protein